jgi:hypothetical protein
LLKPYAVGGTETVRDDELGGRLCRGPLGDPVEAGSGRAGRGRGRGRGHVGPLLSTDLDRTCPAPRVGRDRRGDEGADRAYDTKDFVRQCREQRVTPHVAQNANAHRRSAIDGRTTRHPGYAVSLTSRLLIEKIFGWMKTIGGFRKTRFRGRRKTAAAGAMVVATDATFDACRLSGPRCSPTC